MKKQTIILALFLFAILCGIGIYATFFFVTDKLAEKKEFERLKLEAQVAREVRQAEEKKKAEEKRKIEEKKEETTNKIFIESYAISKALRSKETKEYVQSLVTATAISEALSMWKEIDLAQVQKREDFVLEIANLEVRCSEISYCKSDVELQYFLSTLKQIAETEEKTEDLWKSLREYNYFDEEKREHMTPALRQELARVIGSYYDKLLELKRVQEEICPRVKESLRTPAPYQEMCGEDAQEQIKTLTENLQRQEDINLKTPVCLEYVELMENEDPNADPRMKKPLKPCPAMDREYKKFRAKFLGLEMPALEETPDVVEDKREETEKDSENDLEEIPEKVEMEAVPELEIEPLETQEESEKTTP